MTIHDQEFVDLTTSTGPMRTYVLRPSAPGPIRRTAAFLAGHGFIVAVPEIYH